MPTKKAARSLPWTPDAKASELIAQDGLALLIGFLLDQQVPMEWAFGAPYTLKQRLGGKLDAGQIARMDPEKLEAAFREKPPLHRYPNSMARRTRTLAEIVASEYAGQADRIWSDGADAATVVKRISKLPGLSANKGRVIVGVLAKRLGIRPAGWETVAPEWFSMADVDTPAALLKYRDIKRAAKASGNWPPTKATK